MINTLDSACMDVSRLESNWKWMGIPLMVRYSFVTFLRSLYMAS
jgi:hypothetical protein